MKKVLLALTVFILVFSMAGCGTKKSTKREETKQYSVEGTDLVYKLPKSWKSMEEEAEGAFQKEERGKVVVTFQVETVDLPNLDINKKENLDAYLKSVKANNPYYESNLKAKAKTVNDLKGQYISFDAENDNGEMKYQGFLFNIDGKLIALSMFYQDSEYKKQFEDILTSIKVED